MSKSSRRAVSRNALVAATLIALGLASAVPVQAQTGARGTPANLASQSAYDSFIVKYRSGGAVRTPAAMYAHIDAVAIQLGLNLLHERKLAIGAELIRVSGRTLDGATAARVIAAFAASADIEYVEPNWRQWPMLTPNDTRYNEQWHYYEATAGMNLPGAWDLATGTGVTVAVIDTGITPHSDLSANVVAGYDFVSDAAAARDGNGRDSNPNDEGDCAAFRK